jgi:hypothetical protein
LIYFHVFTGKTLYFVRGFSQYIFQKTSTPALIVCSCGSFSYKPSLALSFSAICLYFWVSVSLYACRYASYLMHVLFPMYVYI